MALQKRVVQRRMAGSARLDGGLGAVGSPPLCVPPPLSRTLCDDAIALRCGPRTQLSRAHSWGPAAKHPDLIRLRWDQGLGIILKLPQVILKCSQAESH